MKLPPLCRYCGGPIRKQVRTVNCEKELNDYQQRQNAHGSAFSRYIVAAPKTKADCEKLTNQTVVSVRRWGDGIRSFGEWDGESYVDEFFCKGACASSFGYVTAREGRCTNAYNAAIAARSAKSAA